VPEGTNVAYTISGVNAADVSGSLTGTALVDSNGKATISVQLLNDLNTEGAETVTVALDNGRASASATVNDTSLSPVYTVTAGAATANEGQTITFSVAADSAVTGTAAVTIAGISAADVEALPTSVNLVDGKGTITLVLKGDIATEGTETVSVTVGSSTATTAIADTSVSPVLGTDSASGTVVSGQGTAIITPVTVLANDIGSDGKALASDTAVTLVTGSATNGEVFTTKDGNFLFVANAGERTGSFKYTAAGQPGEGTVNVTLNTAPVVTANDLTVKEDESVDGTVTVTDADNDTITYSYSAKNGTVTDNGDGKFAYKGNANFNGSDTVTVEVNDGFKTVSEEIAVTVSAVEDAPTKADPAPAAVSVNSGSTVTVDLSKYASDVDSASLTYTAAAGTTTNGGTISITGSTATITYAQGGGSSVLGADSFKVSATDGTATLTDIAVSLNIANTAPTATNFAVEDVKTGVTYTVDLAGKASDAESNTLTPTVVLGSLSNGGSAEVKNGKIVYTSTIGYTGTETLKYTVADGFGGTSSAGTITFTVSSNTGGTSGDDLLYGSKSAEAIDGLAGNDTINGGGGSDTITGGDGNDTITYNDNAKQILGGAGIGDTLVVNSDAIAAKIDLSSTTDQITDTLNNDIVVRGFENLDATKSANDMTIDQVNSSASSIILGNGNDTISSLTAYSSTTATLSIQTNDGNDTITSGAAAGKFSIDGGAGNDTFTLTLLTSTTSTVSGGAGNDTFTMGAVVTSVYGGDGNDTITANGTDVNDYVEGGAGDDTYTVTAANLTNGDTIKGNAGTDSISTAADNADLDVTGKDGNLTGIDRVIINTGNVLTVDNSFVGQSDANLVQVSANNASTHDGTLTLNAAVGSAYTVEIYTEGAVTLGTGSNRVSISDNTAGDNDAVGGTVADDAAGGNDSITGGNDNDSITLNNGANVVTGGDGNDTITFATNADNDNVDGGAGNDTIATTVALLTNGDTIKGGAGTDTISTSADNADLDITGLDQNTTGIDRVVVNVGNTLTIDNSFVGQSDANLVQVSADDHTAAFVLNAAVGSSYTVEIYTEGAVTLGTGSNRVSISDNTAGDNDAVGGTVADDAAGGNDSITGGNDNDSITLNNGANVVTGGDGNDTITFATNADNDNVDGGAGNDSIVTTAALLTNGDTIKGGAGTDTISTSADNADLDLTGKDQNITGIDAVLINTGNVLTVDNSFVGQSDANLIDVSSDGTMTLSAAVGAAYTVRILSEGAVTLAAVNNRVSINDNTASNNDAVGGNVTGGTGNDTITGGNDNDTIDGGAGNDSISGGDGNDTLTLGTGVDNIDGGAGNDAIVAGANLTNDDTVVGGAGTDTLTFTQAAAMGEINVSGVETVTPTLANGQTTDFSATSGITTLSVSTAGLADTNSATLDDVKSGTTVEYNDVGDGSQVTGTTVTINAESGDLSLKTITSAMVAQLVTDATSLTLNTNAINSTAFYLTATALTSLTVSGSGNLGFNTSTNTTALTSFTGSSATGTLNLSNLDFKSTGATITTGSGNATIVGSTGADTITGGAGNDAITMNNASDVLDAGAGTTGDTLVINLSSLVASKVDLTASDQVVSIGSSTNGAIQQGFEHVNASSYTGSGIEITGTSGANSLTGSGQSDIIIAGEGADTVTGGAGGDTITLTETTAAADVLSMTIASDSGSTWATADSVTGFVSANDGFDLDTAAGSGANYAEADGAGFADEAAALVAARAALDGTVLYYFAYNVNGSGDGYLYYDADGANGSEVVIKLVGGGAAAFFDSADIV
jgi:Ca2+-binding RTX toxin-like protein